MKIKNFDALAVNDIRRVALEIAEAGLEAIDTKRIIRESVSISHDILRVVGTEIPLMDVRRIIVAGVGKCAGKAAEELEKILGDRLFEGLVITTGDIPPLHKIKVITGTHPFPSEKNVMASKSLLAFLSGLDARDVVIFLVTGGGSTLLCLPDDDNWQRESLLFGAFMKAGAPIQDVNIVRKHISRVRGGFLAEAMYPARVVSLIFNDVPGSNDAGFIASGPTVKDVTTIDDAKAILKKYAILEACGMQECGIMETPKDEKYFERVSNVVVVSNMTALSAMKRSAEDKGYATTIVDNAISSEAHDVGSALAQRLATEKNHTVLLWGGETTVTLHNEGKGGRNQELAIGALASIPDTALLLAIASDGRDNSDIGGAICDKIVKDKVRRLGLHPDQALRENQSYGFWKEAGDYLDMGETGSNVSDIIIGIKQ